MTVATGARLPRRRLPLGARVALLAAAVSVAALVARNVYAAVVGTLGVAAFALGMACLEQFSAWRSLNMCHRSVGRS